jgi:bifunctional non-homologous end joining protein LigD
VPKSSAHTGQRLFVIQKHAASHLHYDLRLEMNGVLKSWAVPKGPPFELTEKRLAMAVEDHPMDYAHFEGTIPKGEYGGGTVMVWDTGTYEIIDGNYWQGKLHIIFHGKKLEGEWVLVKSGARTGKDNQWLLIKAGSGEKPLSAKEDDSSVLTGRSMEQIAAAADAVWHSNKPGRNQKISSSKSPVRKDPEELKSLTPAKAKFIIIPMLAKAVPELPESQSDWLYELKLDGYRGLAVKQGEKVNLFSRNHNLLNAGFPNIVKALEAVDSETVLDGEIVALDEEGRPSFNILQNYRSTAAKICYYVFDLPVYRGKNLMRLPIEKRRALLQDAIGECPDVIRFSQDFEGSTDRLIGAARDLGMEGLIAKKRGSIYEPGLRTGAWAKYRINKGQELVIGGYIPGAHYFDSLLVGYYNGDKLIFVAKIRNGFTPRLRGEVCEKFKGLETDKCPFANLPEPKGARRGLALTAEAMKECRWLKPKLVAQIEFTDWTENDHLRHSKFVALRDDKNPREVTHEVSAP